MAPPCPLRRWRVAAVAEVLFVPSAFTAQTGPHHWLTLLRARAIENLACLTHARRELLPDRQASS